MPRKRRVCCSATIPVVPEPANGSKTTSPGREPARMHGPTSFGGKVAKWVPLKGRVALDQERAGSGWDRTG
jgi:hypothetical protein